MYNSQMFEILSQYYYIIIWTASHSCHTVEFVDSMTNPQTSRPVETTPAARIITELLRTPICVPPSSIYGDRTLKDCGRYTRPHWRWFSHRCSQPWDLGIFWHHQPVCWRDYTLTTACPLMHWYGPPHLLFGGSEVLHARRPIILQLSVVSIWRSARIGTRTSPIRCVCLANQSSNIQFQCAVPWVRWWYTTVHKADKLNQFVAWPTGWMFCIVAALVLVQRSTTRPGQIWRCFLWDQPGSYECKSAINSIVAGCPVKVSERLKILRVTLDNALSSENHVDDIVKACHFHLRALQHLRRSLRKTWPIHCLQYCWLQNWLLHTAMLYYMVLRTKFLIGFNVFGITWHELWTTLAFDSCSNQAWIRTTYCAIYTGSW